MKTLNPNIVNPAYVQISKKEAATILGMSVSGFDQLRNKDPRCPQGFSHSKAHNAHLFFRLSDVYTYSELRMSEAFPANQAGSTGG